MIIKKHDQLLTLLEELDKEFKEQEKLMKKFDKSFNKLRDTMRMIR